MVHEVQTDAVHLVHPVLEAVEPALVLAPGETRVVHALRLPPGNEATGQFRFSADGAGESAKVSQPRMKKPVMLTITQATCRDLTARYIDERRYPGKPSSRARK